MKKLSSPGRRSSLSLLRHTGRLMRCIRCPVAYHTGDGCVAAGSVVITHHMMICSSHGTTKRNGLLTSPVNVGWCFLCARGERRRPLPLPLLTASLSRSSHPSLANCSHFASSAGLFHLAAFGLLALACCCFFFLFKPKKDKFCQFFVFSDFTVHVCH